MEHLLRAHRHPLHRPRRPHATLQRAPRGPPTPGHATGCQPRQRDPRCSLSNARPSARSPRSANPRQGRGSRGSRRGVPGEGVAHPHGSPQMSHVIPQTVFQTLKSGRCNSNVFSAHQKLTKGNYVRLFGEERLPPATTPPSHRWGLPGTAPPPLTRAASPASTIVRAIRRAV